MQVVVSKTYNYLSIAEDDWVDLDYHESRNFYLDLGQTKGFLDSPSESWGKSRSTWYSSFLSGKIIFLSNRKPFDISRESQVEQVLGIGACHFKFPQG